MTHRQLIRLAGLAQLVLSLLWPWWSWPSINFVGIPGETLYRIVLVLWLVSGLVVLFPDTEELLASRFHRFRPPSALELHRIGPSGWAVCTAAGVDPDKYRVWIYEGPEAANSAHSRSRLSTALPVSPEVDLVALLVARKVG